MAINWQCFGSNGQEKADYSRGVLERFTRRAPSDWAPDGFGNAHIKIITNPRAVNFFHIPHRVNYFEGVYAVNEVGNAVNGAFSNPVAFDKIVVNHYIIKSREEYAKKVKRGAADHNTYHMEGFSSFDHNEEFDDGILKYREERAKNFRLPDKAHADERLFAALAENLSPTLFPTTPTDFYAGKMETFLTCRAVAAYLKTKIADESPAKFFEEASLKAILKTIASGANLADIRLLLGELPNLLSLSYPAVEEIRVACLQIIPQIMDIMRLNARWKDFVELDYLRRLLQTWR